MKKRMFALFLCICIMFTLAPCVGAEEQPLSLIAVADLLPKELINTIAYYGSTIYVPYWLFTGYGLGLSYTYSAANSTACVSNVEKQLFFDLAEGRTYDHDDYQYSVPAIMRGGTVYLPLSFMCSFFGGFSYKNIGGNEYGSILRIHTGNEELTDEEFLRIARPAMQRYYASYYQVREETSVPSPTPTPEPGGSDTQPREGDIAAFGLIGLPSRETLEILNRLEMTACFFLTAEEIRSDPDLVRRLSCSGFALGAYCPEGTSAEYAETTALLWEAARVATVMALLPEGAEVPVSAKAVLLSAGEQFDGDRMAATYTVTAALDLGSGDTTVLFPCDEENETALRVLVYYLRDQGFTVRALRETDETA